MCPELGIPPQRAQAFMAGAGACWGFGWGMKVVQGEDSLGDKGGGECQQERGIPQHLVTGSQQNMSRGALAIYTSPVTIRASRDTPATHAMWVPFLFLALSVLPPPS